jgi:hypothetical protein
MANSALTVECRSQPRYELNIELQYSYERGGRTWYGTGRTRDLSDQTICFESDQDLPGGVRLEVCMPWPVSLQGLFPLDVIIHGALLRKQRSLAVLHLEEFEFRTRGDASFHPYANTGNICNLLA